MAAWRFCWQQTTTTVKARACFSEQRHICSYTRPGNATASIASNAAPLHTRTHSVASLVLPLQRRRGLGRAEARTEEGERKESDGRTGGRLPQPLRESNNGTQVGRAGEKKRLVVHARVVDSPTPRRRHPYSILHAYSKGLERRNIHNICGALSIQPGNIASVLKSS